MTPEAFFEKFGQLTDAPNSIVKIRELVLRMATTGRIAEQDPADQSASELLTQIFAEREDLIERGEAKGRTPGSPITAGDTTDLPPSWVRCNIAEVCDLRTGATPSRQEPSYFGGEIPWLVSGDVNKGEIAECDGRITESGLQSSNCKIIPPGAVLIALNGQGKTRATVAILRIPATLNQSLVAIVPYAPELLLPEYIFWNLRGRYYAIRDITGQKQRRGLNMKLIGQLTLPVPPLAEQKRIVAKVDELMALCDRLEAQRQERETQHAALARASLARFADAPTPANLNFLFHKSYTIPPTGIRKAILQLAFAGRLVAQDPDDEPASVLLEKARAEKARLIEAGLVKKEPWADKLEDATALYRLPPGWEWTRVSDVVEKVTVGFVGSMKAEYREDGVPFLRSQNVRVNRYEPIGLTFISEEFHRSISKSMLRPGDVVVTRSGNVGVTCVIPESLPEANCSDLVVVKRPLALVPAFLSYFINSIAAGQIEAKTVGIALTHFNTKSVAQMTVALPPFVEQQRIVAKVDLMMSLVDELEIQLSDSRDTATNLLDAVVAELAA